MTRYEGLLVMKLISTCRLGLVLFLCLSASAFAAPPPASDDKLRLLVISSYHREYLWSQDTQHGLVDALLQFSYLDSPSQGDVLTSDDQVTSSRAVIHKLWMNTKHKNSAAEIRESIISITGYIEQFQPDLVLLIKTATNERRKPISNSLNSGISHN